eukprot:Phypoly_transcript_20357.p1 GENE.Phypoly_transcript_20357~~Phypoly_transcript_20357.p1  ORF type:complete len:220 (-),score=28.82 Phypoly_transcript_20357:27-641(-)
MTHRILCFGASLVEGYVYTSKGLQFAPFTITLAKKLTEAGYDFEIDNQGASGQTTSDMVPRFEQVVTFSNYTHAIILGGTNDLSERRPEITIGNLTKMYTFAKSKGILPMGVTLPELYAERNPREKWLTDVRLEVNKHIKEFCTNNNMPVLDLATLIPHVSLSLQDKQKIWSDAIHLTAYGYELFGGYAFEALTKVLPPPSKNV